MRQGIGRMTDREKAAKVRALTQAAEAAKATGRVEMLEHLNEQLRAYGGDEVSAPKRVVRTAESGAAAKRRTTQGRKARKQGD